MAYEGIELKEGMPVFDCASGMVGRVESWSGPLVTLYRPSGLEWTSRHLSLREVTAYEVRQLDALGRHANMANRVRT
jgi:hypothetical protein